MDGKWWYVVVALGALAASSIVVQYPTQATEGDIRVPQPRTAPVEAPAQGDASATLNAAPKPAPAAVPRQTSTAVAAADPAWLWGLSERSPATVLEAWRSYARTQGRVYDTARELVRYIQAHPQRSNSVYGVSTDDWLVAVAKDPMGQDIAWQLLASGYLDQTVQRSLGGSESEESRRAIVDLNAFVACSGEDCHLWRVLVMLAPDTAAAALSEVGRQARECNAPPAKDNLLRAAEAYGQAAQAVGAEDWDARRALAARFAGSRYVPCA